MGRSRCTTLMVASLLLIFTIQSYIVGKSTIYVVQSEEQCFPYQMCFTLEGLINSSQTADSNFSMNDTTLLFSYGTHIIGNNIRFTSKLKIQGLQQLNLSTFGNEVDNKSARCLIQCSLPFSFEFTNITRLIISGLTFDKCGSLHNFSEFDTFNMTLVVNNIVSFIAENVTITNTKGFGLFIENVHPHLSLSKMNLSHNEVNCHILQSSEKETTSSLNYSITDSTFEFGNTTNSKYIYFPFIVSGLQIEIANSGTMQFVNNIHYENNGHFRSENFFLHLADARAVNVSIKQLTSTHTKLKKGLKKTGISSVCNDTSQIEITNSTFNNSSIESWRGNVILKNITIRGCENNSLKFYQTNCTIFGYMNILETIGSFMLSYTIMAEESSIIILDQLQVRNNFAGAKLKRSTLTFGVNSKVHFINNTAISFFFSADSSVIYAEDSDIFVDKHSYVKFENNNSTLGGAIRLVNSKIILPHSHASLHFIENAGINGGAIAMYDGSQILVNGNKHNTIRFIGNKATQKGGAIYVYSPSYPIRNGHLMMDFIELTPFGTQECPIINYTNNTAQFSGDNVYGGWLTEHLFNNLDCLTDSQNINYSLLSSDPIRVCICDNISEPNCSIVEHNIEVFPRKKFEIKAVAVGWEFGTVPAIVQARFIDDRGKSTKLEDGQDVQSVKRYCTSLIYTVYSLSKKEQLQLLVESENLPELDLEPLLRENVVVNISIKKCPPGFLLNNACMCHPFLIKNNIKCNTELYKIERTGQVWLEAKTITQYITISKYCSQNYCKSSDNLKQLDLEYPDSQCALNRSGTQCGSCSPGLSQVFGTSKCKKCSNLWVLLIVPVFTVAGIALVVFIMALNLTVAVGTINGLILYANIVRANQDIFYPPEMSNSFLSWFIAWINLDFGNEACFYDGMDAYAKTWLQFLFPLYIWFIVIAIILLSYQFERIAKLCSKNVVPVLATLFLLSYAKFLRVIITVLQPTTLSHSDGHTTVVWTYDGNVDYLKGKHIPLFIAALLLLLFLSLPYTAILLTIQWLQKWSEHRLLFWVNRLKPLFDAYTGPYKDNHRYWTGLLLLVRVILFLVFSLNLSNNPFINLRAIVIVLILMLSIPFVTGQVYKSRVVNVIELSFILNAGVLAAATVYQIYLSKISKWPTTVSTSIAFVTFVIIVLGHLIQRIASVEWLTDKIMTNNMVVKVMERLNITQAREEEVELVCEPADIREGVTQTSVSLREPLLEY